MKYQYMQPEYWRDVPALEGIVLGTMVVLASIALATGVLLKAIAGIYSVVDLILAPAAAYVLSGISIAMYRGYVLRRGNL